MPYHCFSAMAASVANCWKKRMFGFRTVVDAVVVAVVVGAFCANDEPVARSAREQSTVRAGGDFRIERSPMLVGRVRPRADVPFLRRRALLSRRRRLPRTLTGFPSHFEVDAPARPA